MSGDIHHPDRQGGFWPTIRRLFTPDDAAQPGEVMAAERPGTQAAGRVTYTYGIPETVARSLTPEERARAQAPDPTSRPRFVRIVEERLRVAARDRNGRPPRSAAERDTQGDRVELLEEEIAPSDRRRAS